MPAHPWHQSRRTRRLRTPSTVEATSKVLGASLLRQMGVEGIDSLEPDVACSAFVAGCLGLGKPPPGLEIEEFEDDTEAGVRRRRAYRAQARAAIEALRAAPRPRPSWLSGFDRRVRQVAHELGLTPADQELLRLFVVAQLCHELSRVLWSPQTYRPGGLSELVGGALGLRPGAVRSRLAADAPLVSTGLLERADPADPTDPRLLVDSRILELVLEERLPRGAVLARFLTEEPPASLVMDDFQHLQAEVDVAERILRRALDTRQRGVNLLLYGGSGTGKTQLARLLAARVNARLFLAGASRGGEPPSGRERLCSASLAQRILPGSRSVSLLDEAEDVSAGGWSPFEEMDLRGSSRPSKLWTNRLVEENLVPSFWTTNDIRRMDPALLRRFTLVIRFRPLGPAARLAAWKKHVGVDLPERELEALAQDYDVSPAEIGNAVTAGRLAGAGTLDKAAMERVLAAAVEVVPGRRRPAARRAGPEYRPEAVHASTDLVALADRVARWKPGAGVGLSLCLYGLSGTGKSEYVHYLAKRLGIPVVVKRPSDIEAKFVGETEQNIAQAFREAEAAQALLLFDEVDTLLRDRRGATHQWELGFVNEFLQQLEAFRGFVACTTNLFRDLDQAALRRFTFKVEFLAPKPEQLPALFAAHLGALLPSPAALPAPEVLVRQLHAVGELVPGDFAVVARKAAVLGGPWTLEGLVAELAGEARARKEERPIGF